jgi:glutamine---fructose-6-phosphate transaminase (isomerizing)
MLNQTTQLPEMLEDTYSIPIIIKSIFEGLNRATRTAFSYEEILSTKRIILTGCGDSYFAGLAAKYTFEQCTNIPTVAAPAMEVSRYMISKNMGTSPHKPLILGVSVSGEIARLVEVIQRANQVGALTCAITGDATSRAGKAADRIIQVPKMPKRTSNSHVPGTRSFTASLLSMYLLAYHMGEVKELLTIESVNQLGKDLLSCANKVENVIQQVVNPVEKIISSWIDARNFFILGSGPSYATAIFTAAKMVEAAGVVAIGLDVEEWAHFYNFSSDATIPIILFAPAGADISRIFEIVELLRRRGRRLLVITTEDAGFEPAEDILVIHEHIDELTSPLVLSVIGNIIGSCLREGLQVPYFNNYPPDPHPNGNTIVSSQIDLFNI